MPSKVFEGKNAMQLPRQETNSPLPTLFTASFCCDCQRVVRANYLLAVFIIVIDISISDGCVNPDGSTFAANAVIDRANLNNRNNKNRKRQE